MVLYYIYSYAITGLAFQVLPRLSPTGHLQNLSITIIVSVGLFHFYLLPLLPILLMVTIPLLLFSLITYGIHSEFEVKLPRKYRVPLALEGFTMELGNIRRGISITGAAGSGKTESVVYNFLNHFYRHQYCGIIHDYKNFELTELAYPLFKKSDLPFYIISFEPIYHRVNPIAPQYLPDEESVNEVARVLMENLLEQKDHQLSGSSRFFNDAVEGILSGLIWKLKTAHPEYCTLPHLIALYQLLENDQLIQFLNSDFTSRAMADAFISGIDSERQTAAVKGTLANAFKKISTRKIFFCLSGNDIPLDINHPSNPAVVSVVNDPKRESAYAPVIAMIIHTIIKQMSVRHRQSSFVLMEEAPTIRLLHMHRIPATLRSYDITTLYVLQDKIQNDLLYGEKASKAILSNLSYQFFGKANDPTTASYYEQFFELVKKDMVSISKSQNLNFDTRITKSQREVSKLRANLFFRLKPGEFVVFADGKERKVRFKKQAPVRELPSKFEGHSPQEIEKNFKKIYLEARKLIAEL